MRISLNWLGELVELKLTPEELAHTLTMAGFEVEEIEDRSKWAEGVVVGKILEAKKHPNADKLQVCQVDVGAGGEPLNIVCGAPNARADIYVAVATIGTYLPAKDLKIKKAKLRGVPSQGMICSLEELGLAKESEGIHIFESSDLELGSDVRPLLGLDDVILDLTTTANRADALSMVGVAREVAALTGASLRIPEAAGTLLAEDSEKNLAIAISEPESCPIYIGTEIVNLKIAPSPQWLQRRLQAAGLRSINNVVDITNYIVLEWGQPLHAFDREKLRSLVGDKNLTLGVRYAIENESLKTLDGQDRNLQPQNLLITANDKPVAMAGVMGGEDTEVSDDTENIILEAAIFSPVAIRRSARAQGLRTEASTRYERGVNQAELALACRRAIMLISHLAGGEAIAQETASSTTDDLGVSRQLPLRLDRINQVLGPLKRGVDTAYESWLQPEEVEGILSALGCGLVRDENGESVVWTVAVPPYRFRDLEREIDLIEEVARLYGYDNFCDTLPSQGVAGYLPPSLAASRKVRAAFRGAGLTELMHYSLVKQLDDRIAISNPLFVEYSALRTELFTGLLDAFQYNIEKGNGPLNGFEIGRIFWKEGEEMKEEEAIAGIMGNGPATWTRGGEEQSLSWFEAKGILEEAFRLLHIAVEYQSDSENPLLHPGRTASLRSGGDRLGTFGQVHPQVRQERSLPEEVYMFQLSAGVLLSAIEGGEHRDRKFLPYSTFPSADRDIAFFVPLEVSVRDIQQAIAKVGGEVLESIQLFDEYRGEAVPEGQRSLAFRSIYRAGDRTLTDAEIDPIQQKIRDVLVKNFEASLRS